MIKFKTRLQEEVVVKWKHDFEKGITQCRLIIDGVEKIITNAKKHSADNFSKELGRKVSLTRALSAFQKEDRAIAWNAYFARKSQPVITTN